MLRRIRAAVTYSNAVATLALFLALGGTSYALIINGALVQDESLTDADIRNGSLNPAIAAGAIGSGELADRSVTQEKLANGVAITHGATQTKIAFSLGSLPTEQGSISVNVGPGSRRVLIIGDAEVFSGPNTGGGFCKVFGALFIDGEQQDPTNTVATLPVLASENARGQIGVSLMPRLSAGAHTIAMRTGAEPGCGVSAAAPGRGANLHAVVLDE